MNKKLIYIFIVILSCSTISIAQYSSVRFNHIDIDQGLSQNMVRDVIQDSRGFMWIATWDGLNRYDGYSFKVYKNIDGDSTSLRINKVVRVLEDHNGAIWVGTFGGGLAKLNRDTENFTNFVHNPDDPNSLGDNQILTIYEDSKNRLWIGTRNGGVSILFNHKDTFTKKEKIKFINIKHNPKDTTSLSGKGVMSVYEDNYGSFWFGTTDGLLNELKDIDLNNKKFTFRNYNSNLLSLKDQKKNSYEFVFEDKLYKGILWLVDYYTGITWFDIKKRKFLINYPYSNVFSNIILNNVESAIQDSKGIIWIGTYGNGIYSLNLSDKKNKLEHFRFGTEDQSSIDAPNITHFYEDRAGLIWIGTNTNGLYTYYKGAKSFKSFHNNPLNKNSLISNNVLSVLKTPDGFLWIATEIGLDKFNPETNKFTHYKNNPNDPGTISSSVVYSLLQTPDGTLWVGTEAGLDKYNKKNDSFSHYLHNPDDSNSISNGEIIKIFYDSKGTLWLGSWNGGLNKLVADTNGNHLKFLHYKFDPDDSFSLSDNRIMSMAEDKKGNLWIGTSEGGLNKMISDFKPAKDGTVIRPKFKRYQHKINKFNSLSNNDVRSILIDKKGNLWLGTMGGGLNKFAPDENGNDEFIHFRQSDGLANDVVRGLLEDDKGNIWIGTGHGLSRFDPSKNTFWNFYKSDGLQTSKFEDVSYKDTKNGTMYFGGVGGVIAFQPENIHINKYIPPIVITSLKKYNTKTDRNNIIEEKGISEKDEITLSHNDNIVTFELAALNFYNSYKNEYSYKLEGYNNNWINLGRKRDFTFTNLDPGNYTLYVRASNNDGIWNLDGKSLKIKITPPWYLSEWAYLGYTILFVLLVFSADRIQRRRVIARERNRSQLREAQLIKKQADELETVDRLVKIINRAEDLENLFNSLLEQTIKFIPQAEKAAVFLLNKNENLFKAEFTLGYNVNDLESVTFTEEELKKRYMENSEEVERGIFIVKKTSNLTGDEKMVEFAKPMSMLVMAVERENVYEAFVVYDNFEDSNAFDLSAARILNRFREHAVSAILKAQSIKALQKKNEEIIRTQEQLVTQEKLASLGALTAGIAHEIKNPLNFVNNFAELSREMLDELDEEIEEEKDNISSSKYELIKELLKDLKLNFQKINNHGNRADSIIKGMLLHSRGKSGERAPTDLNYLLDQYLMLAYHGLRARDKEFNITIEKDYDESIGKINIIPQDISRVFLNLINNACYAANKKYRNNGKDFTPMIKVATKNLNQKIEVYIKDNGTGIPNEIREKLFNPFFSTKPTGEGTGLGLSLSYDIIVKGHNGDINYISKEGEYTEFIISLPKI